jgi:hypothetical protein
MAAFNILNKHLRVDRRAGGGAGQNGEDTPSSSLAQERQRYASAEARASRKASTAEMRQQLLVTKVSAIAQAADVSLTPCPGEQEKLRAATNNVARLSAQVNRHTGKARRLWPVRSHSSISARARAQGASVELDFREQLQEAEAQLAVLKQREAAIEAAIGNKQSQKFKF